MDPSTRLKNSIRRGLASGAVELSDIVDMFIDINGIIGVGLITLGDDLKKYCYDKISKQDPVYD